MPGSRRARPRLAPFLKSGPTTERLFNAGVEPVGSSPGEPAGTMASEMSRPGKLIKDSRIRGE
jgi:hypothetical protein